MISKEEIEKQSHELKKLGGNENQGFGYLYLKQMHNLSHDEILDRLNFEKKSKGINGFHYDKNRKNLYLYSFHYSENIKLLKDPIQVVTTFEIELLFSSNSATNSFFSEIKAVVQENFETIDRIYIYFINDGDTGKLQKSETLASLREELESKKFFIDNYFSPRKIHLSIDFISNKSKRRQFSGTEKSYTFELEFNNYLEKSNQSDHKLLLGFLKLSELHKIYLNMGNRLFEKNIRAGLSPENGPNRSIRKSLKNILGGTEDPVDFSFNHNGITMSAQNIEYKDGKIRVSEPRILNGAQTITSTARYFEENTNSKNSPESNPKFKSIEILGKIILPNMTKDPSNFIANVTINTNRQNPVEPWNLRASDLIQLEFSDKIRNELGIYYERQENSFESLTLDDYEELGIEQNKSIQIKKLAQTFLAVQGEVDKINKLREIFEEEKKYQNTFKRKYLNSSSQSILLLYKVQFRLGVILKSIIENSPEKYSDLINKSKNLIWCLISQAILNDSQFLKNQEIFGNQMAIEVDFNEYLKSLGAKKIKNILSEIWKEEKFQKSIQENKYSFLKSKAIYDFCMTHAIEKFNWQKIDL
ncbi:MAG: AIPR family protein [Leptospiraceae bacterium]|nr:AIPR family protein [Leptospiraceae bacterium]MCP5510303.1 AIPR family protein [Leptospiraceae bacterium]